MAEIIERAVMKCYRKLNSVPSGYYHLDFDYYKVDSWDGNEYGYVQINDITCWRRTKELNCMKAVLMEAIFLQAAVIWVTYAYKASCSITLNTVSNLNIKISSTGGNDAADESYGIDNVRITQSSFRSSTTCKNCPVGKFLNQPAPTTSCKDCSAGQYQNEEGKNSMQNLRNGQYQNEEGTRQNNSVCAGKYLCKICAESGQYQNEEGQTVCKRYCRNVQQAGRPIS